MAVQHLADQEGSAHRSPSLPLIAAAGQLPWLAPDAHSLAALSRSCAPSVWAELCADPGAVLLLVRRAAVTGAREMASWLADPDVLTLALEHLNAPGFVDWNQPGPRAVREAAVCLARLARALGLCTRKADPDRAWVAGLLAPLGWLAAVVVNPALVPGGRDPTSTAPGLSGTEHDALARRLVRRWLLPDWLAGVIGRLGLSAETAAEVGAEPDLFRVVQAAAGLAGLCGTGLNLTTPAAAQQALTALGVGPAEQRSLLVTLPPVGGRARWQRPDQALFLADLLEAARARRRLERQGDGLLERENDGLHRALERQVQSEADRLHARKLAAVAELAAGAGHEINNPLAVISGQAQYLLNHEADWFAGSHAGSVRSSLNTIIAQTRRIHGLIRDLMQFARPAAPVQAWLDLPTLLGEVASSLGELAEQRKVRVEVKAPDRLALHADGEQLRLALACLLRNAIEAAPPEGWARLVLDRPREGSGTIEVKVEDSGPGPAPEQVPLLFDPFYSGRSAGRGRGLGLPIAWRLARQHGGDVRLDPPGAGAPTRFVLSLPWSPQPEPAPPSVTVPVSTAPSNGFCHA
jgi:two-component system NtrC family sensor kinase